MFEAKCLIAEKKFEILEKSSNSSRMQTLGYVLRLILGIIAALFSLLWFLHVLLYQLIHIFG